MARTALKVATPTAPTARGRRWIPLLPGLAAFAAALVATLLGADRVRLAEDPRAIARLAIGSSLEDGNDAPAVVEALRRLRAEVGRRPLEGSTRVAYAGLLLNVASHASQRVAPAFHARIAARNAPVTVPVIRAAALTLARTGETDESERLVREMFGYAPQRAARLLMQLEPWLAPAAADRALPGAAAAWAAWAAQLRAANRTAESLRELERARARWPDDPELLLQATTDAVSRQDWEALERLLPPGREIPRQAPLALLFLHRARLRAIHGDTDGAGADISLALRLAPNRGSLQLAAGDLRAGLGQWTEARRIWRRFEVATAADDVDRRKAVLLRLARLEHEHGEPVAALRRWRSVAEIEPDNEEARRAIRALTGVAP